MIRVSFEGADQLCAAPAIQAPQLCWQTAWWWKAASLAVSHPQEGESMRAVRDGAMLDEQLMRFHTPEIHIQLGLCALFSLASVAVVASGITIKPRELDHNGQHCLRE